MLEQLMQGGAPWWVNLGAGVLIGLVFGWVAGGWSCARMVEREMRPEYRRRRP